MNDDVLVGGAGNDALYGGAGKDLVLEGAGRDVISGDDDFVATTAAHMVRTACQQTRQALIVMRQYQRPVRERRRLHMGVDICRC